ncbi:MAG: tetraacyldisaccharide 4'-kinase [Candidatus Nitricoxidivorans perseverans]|uniref:Tetraacyldisaccharide 4'-kinase n=1 Tax=Candidatus Nitricoxidivorans perseverans TaxID=2975601 RepID=A0AA49FMW7_9PROT|nr:MAG: tetraacyldisaccharide 4'-kinase [Candidatus Nitricoxidivorans perseverans]
MKCALWHRRGLFAWLLLPVGAAFLALVALRRLLYRLGVLPPVRLPVPVVVVGNITAGGSGKTPLVIWLAEALSARGMHPGVISRGYGRRTDGVREVFPDSTAAEAGDEPLLIRRRVGCPVFVGRDRAAAGRALLAAHPGTDVILSDDGLQHYRLARDVEIAVVDDLKNGWPLPAGPLREPASRLRTVDAVVGHGWAGDADFRMTLAGGPLPEKLHGKRLHAVAGIGNPQRFFGHLAGLGLRFEAHAFPDHHAYVAGDLDFSGDAILTTEKDAVKFGGLSKLPVWVLSVTARIEPDLAQFVLEKIDGRPPA